jgi:hypothetical protein
VRFKHRTPESIWFARKASRLGLQSPAAVLEHIKNTASAQQPGSENVVKTMFEDEQSNYSK